MIFFTIVGIAYILVGFWMIKRKYHSKTPYIIVITGSAALIVFYIATRTVGLQTEIGIIERHSIKDSTRFNNYRFIISIEVI